MYYQRNIFLCELTMLFWLRLMVTNLLVILWPTHVLRRFHDVTMINEAGESLNSSVNQSGSRFLTTAQWGLRLLGGGGVRR